MGEKVRLKPFRGLSDPGCPLCRVSDEAEKRHLGWFLLENYASLPTLIALERKRYCRRHAAELAADSSHDQLTSTFQSLAELELRGLREFRSGLAREQGAWFQLLRGRRELPETAQPADRPGICPACEAGETAVSAEIYHLLPLLATPGGRAAYREHDGFCRPHLWQVLEQAPLETADWLAEETQRKLDGLLDEFALFFHRIDYRYRNEPKGQEQTAWRRALWYFWQETSFEERARARQHATEPQTEGMATTRSASFAGGSALKGG